MINSVLILNFAKFTTDFAVVSFIMFWVLCFLRTLHVKNEFFLRDLFGKVQNVICVVNTHSSLLKQLSCYILYTTNTCIAELEMLTSKAFLLCVSFTLAPRGSGEGNL